MRSLELNPDVVCSPLAEGGVLFDLSTKQYYALNATGLLVWQFLEDGGTVGPLVESVAGRYPDRGAEALGLREFTARLVELGLAQPGHHPPQAGRSELALPASWVLPEVTPHGRPLSKVILSPFESHGAHSRVSLREPRFDRVTSAETGAVRLRLPWLSAQVRPASPGLLAQVHRAAAKYASGEAHPPLTVSVDVKEATAASMAEAGALCAQPTLEYQFVRGRAGAGTSRFATADGSLARVDHESGAVDLRLHPAVFVAPYSTWADLFSAPLAEHWRARGCYPLHAAAMTRNRDTVLIVGASGSGKTTTALALLRGGGAWRADDKILVSAGNGGLRAISLYRNTNLPPATIRAFPELAFAIARPPLDATNDKRSCLLEEITPAVDLTSFEPTAILFPVQVDAGHSVVTRMSETDALLRLAAQSPSSPVRERLRAQHDALCRIAGALPAFLLEAGRDVLTDPEAVAGRLFAEVGAARQRRRPAP